ncbi:MAG: TolC family outer membrane protein [Desulfobacteraceae bacterium]|nr:TolC family outer membrane protein [Desulfobacteraceae bacterium]
MKRDAYCWHISPAVIQSFIRKCLLCLVFIFGSSFCFAEEPVKDAADLTSVRTSVIYTLESNPRLGEIKQNRSAVRKELRQTKGRFYPRVDLDVAYGTDSHSDEFTRDEGTDDEWDDRTEASITLTQPLYHGGEIRSTVKAQTTKLESAEKRVLDNAEALALDAIIAHLEVWRQRYLMDLSNQNIAVHEQILNHIKERQQAGAGSTADVMQANGRLALTLSSRYQIKAELEAATANYHRVAGSYPAQLELPGDFRLNLPMGREDALSRAESCNPKLAAFAADIKTAQNEVDVRKSEYLPRINLELSSKYRNQVESSETYEHNNSAMVRARWNLYNGGSDKAARESAEARKLQVLLSRNDQYNQISEQIHDTWSRYKIAGDQITTYDDAVEFNRQTREAYQQQFVVGQRSLLDVLDAENEYFQSSGQLITAKVNEIVASYRLLALSGCLMKSLSINPELFDITPISAECCVPAEKTDGDADGVLDADDRCPDTPPGVPVDSVGCPLDSDKDGVPDFQDECPNTKSGIVVDIKGCPLDTDLDGVPNATDKCPNTPSGIVVDIKGCPLDTDLDGVPNATDKCPNTPKGTRVDAKGCTVAVAPVKFTKSAKVTSSGNWLYQGIEFELGRWDLKPESYAVLDEIAEGLRADPKLHAEIQGHTDSQGNHAYNISLSFKRARSVMYYMINKGISASRITAKGYGPDRPIAGNDTAEGRAKNRRVELKPIR